MAIEHAAQSHQLQVDLLKLGTPTELTVAAGAVTRTRTNHTVDTESDAATDDLDTISGGTNGDVLYLWLADAARVVTVKHGVANIRTTDGQDIELSADGPLLLIRGATNWHVRL